MFTQTKATTSVIFQVQQKEGLACRDCPPQLPARAEGSRSPARLTPSNPFLLWLLQADSDRHKGIFLPGEGGKPEGLLGSFWKQKSSTSGSCRYCTAPPLQPAPKQLRAPQSSPPHPSAAGGERRQSRGRGGSGGHGWGQIALPLLQPDPASRALHLSRERPKAPGKLNPTEGFASRRSGAPSSSPPRSGPEASAVPAQEACPSPPPPAWRPLPTLPQTPARPPAGRQPAAAGSAPLALGQVPPPTGSAFAPAATHPSIAEQHKARTSGTDRQTDSRAGNALGETARKWRPGLHAARRTLPSAGRCSSSLAATAHARAAGACAVGAAEVFCPQLPGRAGW